MLKEYIDKETKKAVLLVLASVLIFNGLPKLKFFGQYIQKYPIIMVLGGIAIIFYIFKDK